MAGNAMWRNEPDRLTKAKEQAKIALGCGNSLGADSIMLSAYITVLGGKPIEGVHQFKFFLLALWHSFFLMRRWEELNHNQLDVLVQFLLKLRSRMPFTKTKGAFRNCWFLLDRKIVNIAVREVEMAHRENVRPHQTALAFMTCAEALCSTGLGNVQRIEANIIYALHFEKKIRAEEAQPMGLRQFVRILRKAGELYNTEVLRKSNRIAKAQALIYLDQALELARGKADAPDQVEKILAAIKKLDM